MSPEEESHRRCSGKLVFLDVDGVLFQGQLIIALARRRGVWVYFRTIVDSLFFNVGRIGLERFLQRAYGRLRHTSWSEAWEVYRRMPLTPHAAETIRLLRSKGMRVVLITSGVPDPIVKDLAVRLGANEGVGMHAATRNGRLTGEVSGTLSRSGGKVRVAAGIIEREAASGRDMVVVGDDVNNLPLMRRAGTSIGFRSAYAVRQEARHLVDEDDLAAIVPYVIGSEESPPHPGPHAGGKAWHREILRKLFHMTAAAVPFLASRFPLATALLLLWATGLYLSSEYCRINGVRLPFVHWLSRLTIRDHERRDAAMGPLTLALGTFVTFWCLPLGIASACIMIAAVGDSLAGVIGSRWGRVRWPYNPAKTIEGSLAFLVGAVVCAGIYVPVGQAVALGLIATFLESLPVQDWDNFLTPVGAGLCGTLLAMI